MNINESNYVVLDVETNGLSSIKDDLLSISIYQPDTQKIYNRFLPLELDVEVRTTQINGITKKDLENTKPLTQEEVDFIINEYDLCNRTILTYGNLDEKFIRNYLKRKKLFGYEKLHFFNFKKNIISYSTQYSYGNITKDNLCRLYGINNILSIHTGINDCLLEWELFKRMDNHKLLVTNDKVFELNEEYLLPASYLVNYPNSKYHTNSSIQFGSVSSEKVKIFEITDTTLAIISQNTFEIIFRHLINVMLDIEKNDSSNFFIENNKNLKCIGTLPCPDDPININSTFYGTARPTKIEYNPIISKINDFLLPLITELKPIIDYIKQDVFKNQPILSQELVIHPNKKVFTLCDFSSTNAVLKIKSYDTCDMYSIINQLYYESNGRECYIMQIDKTGKSRTSIVISKYKIKADPISFANTSKSQTKQITSDGVSKEIISSLKTKYIISDDVSKEIISKPKHIVSADISKEIISKPKHIVSADISKEIISKQKHIVSADISKEIIYDSNDELFNILTLLKSTKTPYVDNRKTTGKFWIIGNMDISDFMNWCEKSGHKFTFEPYGSSETDGNPGWWIKNYLLIDNNSK